MGWSCRCCYFRLSLQVLSKALLPLRRGVDERQVEEDRSVRGEIQDVLPVRPPISACFQACNVASCALRPRPQQIEHYFRDFAVWSRVDLEQNQKIRKTHGRNEILKHAF